MWLAVDKDGEEFIYSSRPSRRSIIWAHGGGSSYLNVPKGTIERLLNYPLTWDDEAEEIVEYKDNDYQGPEAELLLSKMIDFKDEEYIKLEKKVFNLKKQLEKYVIKIGNQKEEITRLLSQKEDLQNRLNTANRTVGMSINIGDDLVKELDEKYTIIKYLESKLYN